MDLLWLDIIGLMKDFLRDSFEINAIKYFTTFPIYIEPNPKSRIFKDKNQNEIALIKAKIKTLHQEKLERHEIWELIIRNLHYHHRLQDPIQIIHGRYQIEDFQCYECGAINKVPNEKQTDVNIATHLIKDAFFNEYSVAYIVSADADSLPAIEFVKTQFKHKRIRVLFPPKRNNVEITKRTDILQYIRLKTEHLDPHILPDPFPCQDGTIINRPDEWK